MSSWKPQAKTLALIGAAETVIEDAEAEGYTPTLRRVFYALVAEHLLPNTLRAYKNLSWTLDRARWEGMLPFDALDDRARPVRQPPVWDSPGEILRASAAQYRSDWWAGADTHVELWAEKDAVSGILEPLAHEYGIPFLACRGFVSLTALSEAADRMWRPTVILYCGDHDPSGLDMDRDIDERLEALGAEAQFERVALTPEQIDEHRLIPQPTKSADTRARGYSEDGAWELDALPVPALVGHVRNAIDALLPEDFHGRQGADQAARARLQEVATSFEESL